MRIHVSFTGGSLQFDSKNAKIDHNLERLEVMDGTNLKFDIELSKILLIWQMKNYWEFDKLIWHI